jgi:uncharacterized repeat protein (TIGR03803 family)
MRRKKWRFVSRIVLTLAVVFGLAVVATQSAQAQTYTVVHFFTGPPDGSSPEADMIMAPDGVLYGTTNQGGSFDEGTVFKVDTSGTETVLHSFGYSDGAFPESGLLRDKAGNLYGTTSEGGVSGYGTVYKLSESGTLSVLHSFAGYPSDGANPDRGLVRDAKGNFYGTTYSGGTHDEGTVFEVSATGKETVLHNFGYSDGAFPLATLVVGAAGNLYGTTSVGGVYGFGVVFKLSKTGEETILHSFAGNPSDGEGPYGGLIRDAAGNFYGTTVSGGSKCLCGTVFKVDTAGSETVLYSFSASPDGYYPTRGLVRDAEGNLFGTTVSGGSSNGGTVFEVSKAGNETVLYDFSQEGDTPEGGLVQDSLGNLYGTASRGGSGGHGVVFKLTP